MGKIIDSKISSDKKVVVKIEINEKELKFLNGHFKNTYLFCSKLCNIPAQISQRGKKGATKYFKIPLETKSRKKLCGNISYQKIDTATKTFYIYTADKFNENEKKIII